MRPALSLSLMITMDRVGTQAVTEDDRDTVLRTLVQGGRVLLQRYK